MREELVKENGRLAGQVYEWLSRERTIVVLAESCTAGLVAAILAQTPGISKWLAGSFVTYQDVAKCEWLGIDADLIAQYSAVSPPVTEAMAEAALARTPPAAISLAVTGHLEDDASPHAPLAYIALAWRQGDTVHRRPADKFDLRETQRVTRQWEVANAALRRILAHCGSNGPGSH